MFDTAHLPEDRPLTEEERELCNMVNGDLIRVRRIIADEGPLIVCSYAADARNGLVRALRAATIGAANPVAQVEDLDISRCKPTASRDWPH